MNSCPVELEPFIRAYKLTMKRQDEMIWSICGNYVMSAVSTAVEHCLNGKKATSKYIDSPMTKNMGDEKDFTEEELRKQRELFVAKLLVMQSNFELNK